MDREPTTSTAAQTSASRSDLFFNIALTIAEVGLSLLVYQVARGSGLDEVASYLLAALVPVAGVGVYFLRYRSLNVASFLILGFSLLSAMVALVAAGSPTLLLYKDVAVTGLVGLLFLGSIFMGKPLSFYFGARFAAPGTPEGKAWWNGLWQYESFRRSQRQISSVWAVVFLMEAFIKLAAVSTTSFDQAFVVLQLIPIATVAVAMWLTIRISRAAARQHG